MAFKCPHCGAVSYNENDEREQYCGNCHNFVSQWPSTVKITYPSPEYILSPEMAKDFIIKEKRTFVPGCVFRLFGVRK